MIGQTISHYKILDKLGEGGMGVVYRAHDTKLERDVALKFLPPHLSASEDDKARFVQEAKAAATLSHPNICTIYSIEEHESPASAQASVDRPAGRQLFIAMDLVEGKLLRDRMSGMTQKQAIETGIQVAEGLAAAHEKGVVHRDIKPENIMIRKDGIAQIMDFGLAKLKGVSRLTKEGSTVGTAGYMSPEQVQGQDADHRSDIFSLGVLLYEMLTGQLPFKGVHETAIAYEIVNVEAPPMAALKSEITPELDAIILECLEKDPNERTQAAKQVAVDLKRVKRESSRQRASRISAVHSVQQSGQSSGQMPVHPGQTPTPAFPASRLPAGIWIGIAGLLFIALGIMTFAYWRVVSVESTPVRATLLPPEKGSYNETEGGHLALSPDGKVLTFVASDSSGRNQLWVRQLSQGSAIALSGTDDAIYPFWSYDSRTIGFFAEGKLKRVDAGGGPPQILCDADDGRGGAWNQNGVIIFCPNLTSPLHRVSASGGASTAVTSLDTTIQETNHRMPSFLPDDEHFLFVSRTGAAAGDFEDQALMYVGSLDGETKILMKGGSNMSYSSGFIFFVRQTTLMAQRFDPGSLELEGDAFPVVEEISFSGWRSKGAFTVSATGTLIYLESTTSSHNVYIADRKGGVVARHPAKVPEFTMRWSPDGRKILSDHTDPSSGNQDIWIYDIARQVNTRLTFENSIEILPFWSPDGRNVIFTSFRSGVGALYFKDAGGVGKEELIYSTTENVYATDWSEDGKFVLLSVQGGKTRWDLAVLSVEGEKRVVHSVATGFNEWLGSFSPDGRWIAYQSDESGRNEIYVRSSLDGGGKWQISTGGGETPYWRKDGRELYFKANDKLMAVAVRSDGERVEAGIPHSLFSFNHPSGAALMDVSPDGKQFMVSEQVAAQGVMPMHIVLNLPAELARK